MFLFSKAKGPVVCSPNEKIVFEANENENQKVFLLVKAKSHIFYFALENKQFLDKTFVLAEKG